MHVKLKEKYRKAVRGMKCQLFRASPLHQTLADINKFTGECVCFSHFYDFVRCVHRDRVVQFQMPGKKQTNTREFCKCRVHTSRASNPSLLLIHHGLIWGDLVEQLLVESLPGAPHPLPGKAHNPVWGTQSPITQCCHLAWRLLCLLTTQGVLVE